MAEGLPGPNQSGIEIHRFKPVKAESRSGLLPGIVGRHRIHQPADLAHHRHAAVAHRIELANAAGFKAAGHQEGIASCIDQTRESVVVGKEDSNTPWVA
ncbi:MAG: Uncharacterised protein [Synechococcus sp. MIT S9220]|nr:MAG: Uncharacterised protein [Synechococcus sp. MIT S9220]